MEFSEMIEQFRQMCDDSPICEVCQFRSGLHGYLGELKLKREKVYQSCNDMMVRYPKIAELAVERHMQHGCLKMRVPNLQEMEEMLREYRPDKP